MTEAILDTIYWRRRLENAPKDCLHHSIFRCPKDQWERIEQRHREILAKWIGPEHSILDCGCGYGRLLTLLPKDWHGVYLGLDLSPDFVDLARRLHPNYPFYEADLRDLGFILPKQWDWAVLISMRPMIKRNLGDNVWNVIQVNLQRVAKRVLFLEYDINDGGDML